MTVKTILVSIDGSPASRATLDAAILVARRFDVHLDVLHVRPDPLADVPAFGDSTSADLAQRIEAGAHGAGTERAARARQVFEDAMAASGEGRIVDSGAETQGFAASWLERTGRAHKHLTRLGRVHDLIVVGHPSDPKDMSHSLTVDALFTTGRPVLVVPPTTPGVIGRRIAVAWNGSAECARALGGATNFLTLAEEVIVLTGQSERTPVSVVPELEAYLRRHGVAVETRLFERRAAATHLGGQVLIDACVKEKADLLVMGAHTTSRLKQLVLGNATRDILVSAPLPVLMGH